MTMLNGVELHETLRGLARTRSVTYETRTVSPAAVEGAIDEGWSVLKRNKSSVRLRRQKHPEQVLKDRLWTLLFRMGFSHLSGGNGATLSDASTLGELTVSLPVFAMDDEVALVANPRTSLKYSRRGELAAEITAFADLRHRLSRAVAAISPVGVRRHVVLCILVENIDISDDDRAKAQSTGVVLLDSHDLSYYEKLTAHIGPAARYQFFADMLPGKQVAGLQIRIPAVKAKMGGTNCYTFSITPDYLLKVSYVSHRAKGKASDVDTYQRMLSKPRLQNIRQYISKDGVFPTNIVVNFEPNRVQFNRVRQEGEGGDYEGGVLGWLNLRAVYKSAWIIDGQHRLFAYSGHPKASNSRVSVLAFEGLPASKQAEMFIDINAKQKSVKQSLLQELYAELHWNAEDPAIRIRAIISKAVQDLDVLPNSPLLGRIQKADSAKDFLRCVSLTSLFEECDKPGLYVAREKNGNVIEYGPLWAGGNEDTLKRTISILGSWLDHARAGAPDWWNKGSDEGGGLAMNDGLRTLVNVLRSVFVHLESLGAKLIQLDNEELWLEIQPFANALGQYLGSLTEEQRRAFRALRGNQGIARRTKHCQLGIRDRLPDFNPAGLDEFIEQERAQTNSQAKNIIDSVEVELQRVIIDELKREIGPADSEWWIVGIPQKVRQKASHRYEEEDGKRGGKEYYFDLIDYRAIILHNWNLFQNQFAFGKKGASKDKLTSWLNTLNERRKVVAHASSGANISLPQLQELEEIQRWFVGQISEFGGTLDSD
ncbi:MAG TPA: DGQHR domain-containing protein [Longimicrobiaceae bacterium]